MARNDVYLNINALSPADAVVTGQQDMTAATVPELVLGDTPTFNFYFTDNTNVWPSWAGNASYTLTWALSDAVAGDFAPAATTGNATPITGGWSVILPLNSYDLVGLLNTKRVGQPYPVQNLWQQLRVTDPSGNEVTRAMFWTPVRYRAISDTQNTESASPTGGRFVTVNNVNTLTTPTAAQFYAANPVPTSALGTAANGELLIGNGTGFTKATLTAGSGVSITNGSGSITITATDGDITLDDGTAAAPSLKFTADTDTGLFRPSDNVVGISAGGVSRATFGATSAINGTTIPGSKTLVVTTDKLSALAATTSAELAGVISDETGSGALVFANTPTLVTPNIGAATGTSFNLTGSGTLGTTLTVNGTTDSSSKDTGAIVTEGGLGVEKSATFGGNLTVSGTASVTGQINGSAGYQFRGATGTTYELLRYVGGTNNPGIFATVNESTKKATIFASGSLVSGQTLGLGAEGSEALTLGAANATLSGNLTVSGTGDSRFAGKLTVGTSSLADRMFYVSGNTGTSGASQFSAVINPTLPNTVTTSAYGLYLATNIASGATVTNAYSLYVAAPTYAGSTVTNKWGLYIEDTNKNYVSGNFLLGTTIDGGQKLQVSGTAAISSTLTVGSGTNTFGVGGTTNQSTFVLNGGSSNGYGSRLELQRNGSAQSYIGTAGNILGSGDGAQSDTVIYANGSNQVRLYSGNAITLTLDSSQNATFAGSVKATTKVTIGNSAQSPSIYGSSSVTVGTTAVDLSSTSFNTGAIAVVSGYNNSGGQQGVWLIIATGGGLISTVASQNATGLTPTFSISAGKLQMSLASGSMSVVMTILGVTGL